MFLVRNTKIVDDERKPRVGVQVLEETCSVAASLRHIIVSTKYFEELFLSKKARLGEAVNPTRYFDDDVIFIWRDELLDVELSTDHRR